MPWWGYVLIALSMVVLFFWVAISIWNASKRRYRDEFIRYLNEHQPDVQIRGVQGECIFLKCGELEMRFNVYNMARDISNARLNTYEQRLPIYENYSHTLTETNQIGQEELSLEKHRALIFPRIQHRDFLSAMPTEAKCYSRSLDDTPLIIAYVIDFPHSMQYIMQHQMDELHLNADQLHEIAMENLSQRCDRSMFDGALKDTLVRVFANDSYDAARALMIPQFLQPGQAVAIVIPDRDTLAVMPKPVSPDGWKALDKLAKIPLSDRLIYDKPLLVTCEGFIDMSAEART
ncbi:MAG: DUF1444 family protein [Gemmatales bacterium]